MELRDGIASEVSLQFLQGMVDRMAVSYHKYGAVKDAAGRFDNLKNVRERVDKYLATGNTEWLIDAANFAMMEFMFPQHPEAHFRATDSDESTGRWSVAGRETSGRNVPDFHGARGGD